MHLKGVWKPAAPFALKQYIGMCEYNWNLKNPNKKALKGSKFDIHTQVTKRGQGAWRDGVHHHCHLKN